ncbi:hypothetical protein LSAT2_027767 [Lamellibrachia satsuma]|nr:hypothetical protein LSAT2_027767 [Lamellibrachia satsuma]
MTECVNESVVILESDDDDDDIVLVNEYGVEDVIEQDVIFVKRSRWSTKQNQPADHSLALSDNESSLEQSEKTKCLPESGTKTLLVTSEKRAINSSGKIPTDVLSSGHRTLHSPTGSEEQLGMSYEVSCPARAVWSTTSVKLECTCNVKTGLCEACITKLKLNKLKPVSLLPTASTGEDDVVPLKKQRLHSASAQPLPSTSGLSSSDTHSDHNLCFGCGILITTGNLSQCLNAHQCCSLCFQQQAKSLLTKQSKGSLQCLYPECDSFYTIRELRKTLPPMVVDIVEEKLEQEYLENAAKHMLGDMSNSDQVSSGEAPDKGQNGDSWTVPPDWEPMVDNEEMKTVDIVQGSYMHQRLLTMFHRTMHTPRAKVVRIQRVQNPVLWQFYSVKRKQMMRINGVDGLLETYLFHGTSKTVVEAICKNNFDWRLCGRHGTAYGKGSYFARDASYAHKYTTVDNAKSLTALTNLRQQFHMHSSNTLGPFIGAAVPTTHVPMHSLEAASDTPATHTMFIARVLVGMCAQGYSSLCKPPPLNAGDPYGKSFDSCINNISDPSIFVIFDNAQCYPEFIVDYTNVPQSGMV